MKKSDKKDIFVVVTNSEIKLFNFAMQTNNSR